MKQAINILMIGGKRCGKTTVLASMYADMQKAVAGADLELQLANEQTRMELLRATEKIQEKMDFFQKPLTRVEVDENPTDAKKEYSFLLTVNKTAQIPFYIHDIPGEWLVNENQEMVKRLISISDVIIIAIDTPYLFSKMTSKGYGIYHEEYNKPMEIANFFKNSLSVENIKDRMILFVPIKCERYYHLTHSTRLNLYKRDYMQEIVDAIGYGYGDLLSHLRSTPELMNSCTIAITPILSAGGIDFIRFRKDEETGKVVSLYQEPEFLPDGQHGYRPQFCEQPLIYSLIYILSRFRQERNAQPQAGLFRNKQQALSMPLDTALDTLRMKIKRGTERYATDGYYFIQNPKDI